MKKTEELFAKESNFDSKNILNRLNQKVSQSILDRIEAGITLEDLDLIGKQGIPIFKYKTQITIHGLFENLQNHRIFGYQNLFQNKNKSIGIKWNAIDEEKRESISEKLKFLGFYYNRTSTTTCFFFSKRLTEETLAEAKSLFSKTDTSLFLGQKYLWIGDAWGVKYINLDIRLNAIYQKNVQPFLDALGATEEVIQAITAEKKKQEQERAEKWKLEEDRKQQERKVKMEQAKDQIQSLEKYPKVEKCKENGIYIKPIFDHKENLVFSVIYIYTPERAKKPRWNSNQFQSVKEALEHNPVPRFSDSVFNGTVTAHKIK